MLHYIKMFACIVIVFLIPFKGTASEVDDLSTILLKYQESAHEVSQKNNFSETLKTKWLMEWENRLEKAILGNPQSEYVQVATVQLLGIRNSLGYFEKSIELLKTLENNSKLQSEKIRWLNEMGEIFLFQAKSANDHNLVKKATEAYELSDKLYNSLSKEEMSDDVIGRQIIAFSKAGSIAEMQSKEYQKAAQWYKKAKELSFSSQEGNLYATQVGYSQENIIYHEMSDWLKVGNESESLKALESICQVSSLRFPPSFYALSVAEGLYQETPKKYQSFIDNWLKTKPVDERFPILMAKLGNSYYQTDNFDLALPILERLRNEHEESFKKLEPIAFQNARGGCYVEVLKNLTVIYMKRNNQDEVKKLKEKINSLFHNSVQNSTISQTDFNPIFNLNDKPQQSTITFYFRIAMCALGVILMVIGIYLYCFYKEDKHLSGKKST